PSMSAPGDASMTRDQHDPRAIAMTRRHPFDLEARMTTPLGVETAMHIASVMQQQPPLERLSAAAARLEELVAASLQREHAQCSDYQSILFYLHTCRHAPSRETRAWLASRVYAVEDRFIPAVESFEAVPVAQLREKMDSEIASSSRLGHPMFA